MKILIVDDSISVRKALEKILISQNFDVIAAEHAEKALEMMGAQPELVIADVVMPGMTGFELCQTLKQDSTYQHIPVMLISGIVNANVENQARQVGAVSVIKKPFTPDELIPKIKNIIQKQIAKTPDTVVSTPISVPPISVPSAAITLPQIPVISQEGPKVVPPVQPKPVIRPATKPVARPAVVLRAETQQDLDRILRPILEKTDVMTVLLVDENGHCTMSLGQELSDRQNLAAYIKFLTSASGVLGQNLGDTELKSMVLEYAQRCVVVSRVDKMGIAFILKDMAGLSIARYMLKKIAPEMSSILEGKILV